MALITHIFSTYERLQDADCATFLFRMGVNGHDLDSKHNFIDKKRFVMIFADNIFDMYQNTKQERKGIKSGNCRFIKTGSGNRITGKDR